MGDCTEVCGGGMKTRTRTCNNPAPQWGGKTCAGLSSQSTICNTQPCHAPIDGQWGMWTRFSKCDKECERGEKYRTRKCNNPRPQYGGKGCPASDIGSQEREVVHCN